MIFIGEEDEVIPKEVPERILDSATNAHKKVLRIFEKAPHLLLPILFENKSLFTEACHAIVDCIRGDY